jgi:hypothetical protein
LYSTRMVLRVAAHKPSVFDPVSWAVLVLYSTLVRYFLLGRQYLVPCTLRTMAMIGSLGFLSGALNFRSPSLPPYGCLFGTL